MEKNKPLISVIIPVYKVEQFLPRCVDSVLIQTYRNLEIILVDDGSPDNCPVICDRYAKLDSRVRVIHQSNSGLSEARNEGISVCKGEYLYLLDSDDYISSDCIELLYDALKENDCDVSVGILKKIYDNDNIIIERENKISFEFFNGNDLLKKIIHNEASIDFVIACNKIIKTSIMKDIKFPKGKFHEDEYFNWKLYLKSTRVCYVKTETYMYYQRATSITGVGFGIHNFDYLGALYERVFYFKNNNTEILPLALKQYRRELIFYFYLRMIESPDLATYPYSLNDIKRLYRASFSKDLPRFEDVYSIKEIFRYYLLFFISPSLFYILIKIIRKLKKR